MLITCTFRGLCFQWHLTVSNKKVWKLESRLFYPICWKTRFRTCVLDKVFRWDLHLYKYAFFWLLNSHIRCFCTQIFLSSGSKRPTFRTQLCRWETFFDCYTTVVYLGVIKPPPPKKKCVASFPEITLSLWCETQRLLIIIIMLNGVCITRFIAQTPYLGIEFYLFVSHGGTCMNDTGSMCKFRNARSAFRNLHVDPLFFIPPWETNK